MLTGISTACFYPMNTEDALLAIASLKVEAVEVFVNCLSELSPKFLRKLRSIADGHGVKILSLHPYTTPMDTMYFFSGYERRFHEGMELYKNYYEAANILGSDLVVFHGGARQAGLGYEEYFDRFGKLVEDSVANGSNLCHENVSRCIGYCPEFFTAMAKAIPKAEFVFDIKQAIRAGADVFDFADAMGGRIRHIHYSDHDSGHDCLPPGKGDFNMRKFLDLVRINGFNRGVIVELYRENFGDIVELHEGYQRLSTYIFTLSKNAENNDKIRQNIL